MKTTLHITFALTLGLLALMGTLTLIKLPSAHASPNGSTRYVAISGNNLSNNCANMSTPCRTAQHAVDMAASGDEILIATGVYTDVSVRPRSDVTVTGVVTQVVYISKTVTIRGGYTTTNWTVPYPVTQPVTLDAQGRGRTIYVTGDISPTIEGLRITGGKAAGLQGYEYFGSYDAGGGVYVITATATLNHNWIVSNTSSYVGGGLYLGFSSARLYGNVISGNVAAAGAGAATYNSLATLEGNTIVSNTATNLGGGLYLFSSNAAIKGNAIVSNTASVLGGGVDVASCNPTFNDNLVSGNTANRGGGLYLWYSHSALTNNVIAGNQADTTGSGLWIGGSRPHLVHNTIARNMGGAGQGVYVTDDGSGSFSTVAMTNTILVSHTVGVTATTASGNQAVLNGVLWYGNMANYGGLGTITVTNAITGNPAFAPDGYHLLPGSPAINAGVVSGVAADIDGEPRVGAPDLGADEYVLRVFLPLVLRQ